MAFRNHVYIEDGFVYRHYVLDGEGRHVRMSTLWEKWNYKSKSANPPITKVQSFDWNNGYVTNDITDLRVAGSKELFLVSTEGNRKLYMTRHNSILTDSGFKELGLLGIGTKLITMDNYKGYYGDTISLRTDGNSRVRALLRNHGIPFEVLESNGTRVGSLEIDVVEHDVLSSIQTGPDSWTFGLNNYRSGVQALLSLPEYTVERITKIEKKKKQLYTIGMYVSGEQNVVLTNGLVLKSTQTEVSNDRRYTN